MSAVLPWLLLVAPAAVAAVITVLNVLLWEQGDPEGRFSGRVSVCIPARNEAATIEACVRAALASRHPLHEVVVFDDARDDATPDILARLSAEDARLKVVMGTGLPPGWVGKPHACHQLSRHATGDLLLFIDADTTLQRDGVGCVAALLEDAALVTAVPAQETGTLAEQLILPLLYLTYTAWLPLPLIHRSADPRFLAANGQILAVRRAVYDAVGGFEAVRSEVVDDMAFCRRVKTAGHTVRFADGALIARCRMYTSAREVWEGFSKNLYEGLGGRPLALLGVMVLYSLAFVAPYGVAAGLVAAGSGPAASAWLSAAAAGVGLNLIARGALAWRFQHSFLSVLLHPLAVLGLLAIAVNSFLWTQRGAIRWRGRTYAARGDRQ